MNKLLKELGNLKNNSDQKQIATWAQKMEDQIQNLNQSQQNFYYLLLSEIYTTKLRDISKAYQLLNKVETQKEVNSFEYRLRLCYYRFLEGDYEQALRDINFLKVNMENSSHARKMTIDFFKRIINRNEEQDILQQQIQQFQKQYLKGLRFQCNNKIENAQKVFMMIYKKYSNLDPALNYEIIKHILMINEKTKSMKKSSISIPEQHLSKVLAFEKTLQNKDYYYSKVEFLKKVISIVDSNEQLTEETDYAAAKKYVVQSIHNSLSTIKDKSIRAKLQTLMQTLQEQNPENQQICFKFLGQKRYRQIVKANANKKSKIKPKQSSLRPNEQSKYKEKNPSMSKTNNIKETYSKMQSADRNFRGSKMIKINMNSRGYEERYFHIKSNFRDTKKLFYCDKKQNESSDNDYYKIKGLKKVQFGKKSQAFKRDQCRDFDQQRCFTLKIEGEEDYQRNFYVQNLEDYENWTNIFVNLINDDRSPQRVKKTLLL